MAKDIRTFEVKTVRNDEEKRQCQKIKKLKIKNGKINIVKKNNKRVMEAFQAKKWGKLWVQS